MNIEVPSVPKASRTSQAYTLVEVLVAVGLLAIMLSAIYPAFILGFASIKTTREDQRATQILTQKLEAIRLCTWQQLSNCPTTFVDYYNPLATNGALGTVFAGRLFTTGPATNLTHGESYAGQIHLVTISVSWTNYVAKIPVVHTRQMQTFSALNGLQNYNWGNSQ